MLEAGFLDEVRCLHARTDLNPGMPSIRSVGYRQAWEHLDGMTTHAEMIERAVAATRQLAKRQLTWLRSWQGLQRFETDDPDADNIFAEVLKRLRPATI
jgi:tRNA dimethylallyltransferase